MAAAAGAGLPVLTGGGISSSAMDLPAFACFSRLLRVFRPRLKLCRKVFFFLTSSALHVQSASELFSIPSINTYRLARPVSPLALALFSARV